MMQLWVLLLMALFTKAQVITLTSGICSFTTGNYVLITSHGTRQCTDILVTSNNWVYSLLPETDVRQTSLAQINNMINACFSLSQISQILALVTYVNSNTCTFILSNTYSSLSLVNNPSCTSIRTQALLCRVPVITYSTQFSASVTVTVETFTTSITSPTLLTISTNVFTQQTVVDTSIIESTDTVTSVVSTVVAETDTVTLTESTGSTRTRVVTETFYFTQTTILDTTTLTTVRTETVVSTILTSTQSTTETFSRTICTLQQTSSIF